MSHSNMKHCGGSARRTLARLLAATALACAAGAASAAVPGITGTSFALQANQGYNSQPDGAQIYSWGYGCSATYSPVFSPASFAAAGVIQFCPGSAVAGANGSTSNIQLPGPTLIVTEGQTITVTLTNHLPPAAGNTSIMFPGFTPITSGTPGPGQVLATTGTGVTQGVLAMEAATGATVTYTLNTTGKAGTHAYYSGTQPDLQVEMGMYGALVVLPATPGIAPGSAVGTKSPCVPLGARIEGGLEYRHAPAAYDHPDTCYDIEYLWQWGEIDPVIHSQAETQVKATATCANPKGCLSVFTEPYHPRYFVINGRSMPDDMDADYAPNYPAQPYNGNPHMHPLDQVLIRTIGQGRWEHPFHEHANHVRILARDGNLILSQTLVGTETTPRLAGLMMFNTDTWPGQAFDGIFYWSGKGLAWDIYGHTPKLVDGSVRPACTAASQMLGTSSACEPECVPDANGYFTKASPVHPAVAPSFQKSPPYALLNPTAASLNYGEWCADHEHPLEANPAGQVGVGGPATLPDPLVATNGLWFNGTPYLGPDAVTRSRGPTPLPPGGALQNPLPESGISFMWHSHNEREITTNDVFPGGMLMMMLVDPPVWYIDETL
jgi:FtsP/CotA-like multicopper oxidase with cupredoxin domain